MKRRLYQCEIPGCGREVSIRSTIKSGEHKGKRACLSCKAKNDGSSLASGSKLRPFTKKTLDRRREERKGLPEFFKKGIQELKENPRCQNCGATINVSYEPVRNIAHILPKSRYKSVMSHPDNKIFLCSSKDNVVGVDCHHRFDNNMMDIPNMPCYKLAKEKFEKFKGDVLERGKLFTIFEQND